MIFHPLRNLAASLLMVATAYSQATLPARPNPCLDADTRGAGAPLGSPSPLHDAIRGGEETTVRRLVRDRQALASRDQFGNTALVTALLPLALFEPLTKASGSQAAVAREQKARLRIIDLLLTMKADARAPGAHGITPLIALAQWGYSPEEDARIAQRLLAAGADVNGRTKSGETALIAAARRGKMKLAAMLLSNGARKDAKSCDGFTAADLAEKAGQRALAASLR